MLRRRVSRSSVIGRLEIERLPHLYHLQGPEADVDDNVEFGLGRRYATITVVTGHLFSRYRYVFYFEFS
jgi:hypothetical protein